MFAKSVLGFYALPIWTALWLYIAYPVLVSTKPVATSKHWFTIIGGSCYKYTFCRDKIILFVSTSFVATNICRDKHNFVATNVLSQQAYFCRDKHVSRQIQYCRDNLKNNNLFFCCDKSLLVATNTCLSWQIFAATKPLWQQIFLNYYFVATKFCRGKHNFVATKNGTCGSSRKW